MTNELIHRRVEAKSAKVAAPLRRSIEGRMLCMMAASLLGLWAAHEIISRTEDPGTRQVALPAGLVIVVSLGALVASIACLVSSSQSRARHVFCGRRSLVVAACLSMLAVVLIGSLIQGDPFRELAASGKISTGDLVDLSILIAVIACSTGAGTALNGAWTSLREESRWHRHADSVA